MQVSQSQNEGYIDAIVHFRVFDQFNNLIGEDDYSFRMWMREENNRWVMWGDGNCVDTPTKAVQSWKDRIGKQTKTGSPTTRKK